MTFVDAIIDGKACLRPLSGHPGPAMEVCGDHIEDLSRYCLACQKLLWVPPAQKAKRKKRTN
jgi:hypothetical protein